MNDSNAELTIIEINLDGTDVKTSIDQPRVFEGAQTKDGGPVFVSITDDNTGSEVQIRGDRETAAQFFRELARNLDSVSKITWETTITVTA